jgi:hypothetical protein
MDTSLCCNPRGQIHVAVRCASTPSGGWPSGGDDAGVRFHYSNFWLILNLVCGFRGHEKCFSGVRRPCVSVPLARSDFALQLELNPESSLAAQHFRCTECAATIENGSTFRNFSWFFKATIILLPCQVTIPPGSPVCVITPACCTVTAATGTTSGPSRHGSSGTGTPDPDPFAGPPSSCWPLSPDGRWSTSPRRIRPSATTPCPSARCAVFASKSSSWSAILWRARFSFGF